MSKNFHVAPDGKLYFTDIHNLKVFNGTTDFCVEYTVGDEHSPNHDCNEGVLQYDEDNNDMFAPHGECNVIKGSSRLLQVASGS